MSSLMIAVLVAAAANPGERLFDTSIHYTAGDYPGNRYLKDLALDDLDGDGDLDAIMPRRGGFANAPVGLTILENTGGGAFGPPIHINVAGTGAADGFSRMVLADFDGDGDRDVAVSRPGAWSFEGGVSIFRNNAGMSYTYVGSPNTGGAGSAGIDAADFDGDGDIDLVVALPGGGFDRDFGILLNQGSGTFVAGGLVNLGAVPNKIATGDLDQDGDVDVAVMCRDATVRLLMNDGAASFTPTALDTNGSNLFYCDVAVGDIDNDGDLDLVASRSVGPSPTYAFARNDGTGSFGAWQIRSLPPYMGHASIELVDVSQDGWLDVLVAGADETVNGVWTLGLNDGAGSLPSIGADKRYFGGEGIEGLAMSDIDEDGDIDVLTAAGSSMQLTVHFNPGDHDFRPGQSYAAPDAHNDAVAGDVDGDGDLDIVSSGYTGAARMRVWHNDGAGGLIAGQLVVADTPSGTKLGDIDNDGDLDLAWVENQPPYEAYTALNQGDGTFGPQQIHFIQCGGPGDSNLYDVDGDGNLDHVVVNRLAPQAGYVGVSLGLGDGTFQSDQLFWVGTLARGLAAADLDEDGHLDLIATVFAPGSCCSDFVAILLGNGDGTFQPKYDVQVDYDPWDIVAVDFDGDGHIDLATCNSGATASVGGQYDDESVSVLLGNGDGTFQPRQDLPGSFSPNLLGTQSITAADADHDGDLDLLVSNAGSHDVSIFANHGNGTFAPVVRYGTVGAPLEVLCVDLTGDRVNDLVTTAFTNSPNGDEVVTVIPGMGTAAVPGDISGDGTVDIQDLVAVLAAWGDCAGPDCAADLDGSGAVDLLDLLVILANWSTD